MNVCPNLVSLSWGTDLQVAELFGDSAAGQYEARTDEPGQSELLTELQGFLLNHHDCY